MRVHRTCSAPAGARRRSHHRYGSSASRTLRGGRRHGGTTTTSTTAQAVGPLGPTPPPPPHTHRRKAPITATRARVWHCVLSTPLDNNAPTMRAGMPSGNRFPSRSTPCTDQYTSHVRLASRDTNPEGRPSRQDSKYATCSERKRATDAGGRARKGAHASSQARWSAWVGVKEPGACLQKPRPHGATRGSRPQGQPTRALCCPHPEAVQVVGRRTSLMGFQLRGAAICLTM
jgi:hypothetical protein